MNQKVIDDRISKIRIILVALFLSCNSVPACGQDSDVIDAVIVADSRALEPNLFVSNCDNDTWQRIEASGVKHPSLDSSSVLCLRACARKVEAAA